MSGVRLFTPRWRAPIGAIRCASTSTAGSSGTAKTPRPPLESTTFEGKSHPSEVYSRPEPAKGMPPPGTTPAWSKGSTSTTRKESPAFDHRFQGPSKPRMVYERPLDRDLPKLKSKAPLYFAVAILGLGAAGLFVLNATNSERLASSVLRQVMFQLRNSREVIDVLGENVKMADNWWGFGQPWTSGSINMMQGRVDLKFRITGSKGAGTVFFTSLRPQQEGAWRIVRFKVNADSGDVVRLEDKI